MPQQPKVDDWEDVGDWQDVSEPNTSVTQPTTTTEAPVEQPSFLNKAWHTISDPITDLPSRFAKSIGDYIDQPALATSPTGEGGFHDYLAGVNARMKGFGAGALQGLGDIATNFTSPLNLATTLATTGASSSLTEGVPGLSRGLSLLSKGLALPVVAHGASEALDPSSTLSQRGMGVAEMAGGGAAFMHTPTIKSVGSSATKAAETTKIKSSEVLNKVDESGHIVDPYSKYREVPTGTKYTVSPGNMSRRKMADAIKLGFDYEGLTDDGKIIIKKNRPSPQVNIPENPIIERNAWEEAANLPRTIMASMDLSAPLRQGLGLIHKKAFWTSLPNMIKAFGSEDAYRAIQESIYDDPMFKKTINARGQLQPSYAEKVGLKLTDLDSGITNREESMLSSLAEKIPGIRASNRAYTAFLNKLRADTFKEMVTDFKAFSGLDTKNNMHLGSQIADFVNTASGRGSLGKLENSANALSTVLFSPRLIASRLGMMAKGGQALFSPEVYMLQNSSVRREYLKSLFAVAGAAGTFTGLAKLAGAGVEKNSASSDFGKVKFGNTRIDPYGGFQQYIVAAQRLMPQLDLSPAGIGEIGGKMKSTTTGREYDLTNPSYGQSNRMDILTRFIRSKTNPIINFGWGLLAGDKELSGKPIDITNPNPFENSLAQRFLPMLSQDIYDLVKDETTPPQAKALAAFMASVGMGSQTYGNR